MIGIYMILGVLVLSLVLWMCTYKKNKINSLIIDKQNEFGEVNVTLKNSFNFKYSVSLSVVLLMIMVPLVNKDVCEGDVLCFENDVFSVVEVSAGEYLVNSYGDGFSYGFNVLVINPDILTYGDGYEYYANFNKYIRRNDLVEFEAFDYMDKIYSKVVIDDRVTSYFEVYQEENRSGYKKFHFEFQDFENDIYRLYELLEEYPPKTVRKYYEGDDYHDSLEPNDDYLNITDEYERSLYKMYFEASSGSGWSASKNELERYEFQFYFDGTPDDIGETYKYGFALHGVGEVNSINQVLSLGYDEVYSNNPLVVIDDQPRGSGNTSNDIDSDIYMVGYINNLEEGELLNSYMSVLADISLISEEDRQNLIVEIEFNGIKIEEYYIVGDYLVIPPTKVTEHSLDTDRQEILVHADFNIKITNGEEISELRSSHSMQGV